MRTRRWALAVVAVSILLLASLPLLAHHGTASFEMAHTVTIKGTVIDYQLINPHAEITIKVLQDDGSAVEWNVESVSATMLVRVGWKRDTLKAGDVVSVTGHPAKGGKPSMLMMKAVLPDGRELPTAFE